MLEESNKRAREYYLKKRIVFDSQSGIGKLIRGKFFYLYFYIVTFDVFLSFFCRFFKPRPCFLPFGRGYSLFGSESFMYLGVQLVII